MKKQTLLFLILLNTFWVSIESVCAQNSPNIAYSTPQIFTVGNAISTLSPTNTGGAVYPGNYGSPTIFTSYTTPFSLAVDASNNVYTTNNTTGDLTKFSSDGTVVFTVNTGFNQASGIGVDGAGNIYVSQFTANTVLRYNSSGQLIATIKNFSDPYGIAFDSSNNAYIANYHTGVILKVAANDTTATTYITGLNTPYGIAIDASGNMYVGEEGVGDIIKFAAGTLAKTVFASGFNGPRHLNKDSFGNIYVADFGNNAIKRISPSGTVTSILSSGLTTPRQAAFDSSGNLFIADFGTNNLKKSLATKYSITGTLPAGLSFDTSTGEISGTPTVATAATAYTITAYNTGGSSSTTLTITVNPAVTSPTPPTVSLAAATDITASSATLNGSVNSNGQATTVTFTYSENSDFTGSVVAPATTGSTIDAGDSANPTLAVTGLKPASTYYYLITAKNPSGSITRGGDSFTTLSSGAGNTQTISFTALASKTYGDADFDPGASVSGGGTISYSSDNTAVATIVNGEIHIVGAGSANITAASQNAGNVSQKLVVNKAALTVTANSISRNAGVANPALTVVYSGFVNGDNSSDLTTQPSISTTATISSAAGTYPITVTGAASDNYTFNYVQGVLTVTQGTLLITFNTIPVQTYGDADFDPGASVSGGGTISYSSDNTSVVTIVNGEIHIVGAGSANITAASQNAGNVSQNLVINKATLTVTANSASRNAGVANPALTFVYSGFVNGDNSSSLTTQPAISTTATINSAAGNYPITVSGAASDNYTFNYVQGVLTVTPGTLTLTFNPIPPKTYGDADFDPGASAGSGTTIIYTSDNPDIATIVNGKVHIVGAGTANITATQGDNTVTQNLVINKANQTISFAEIPNQITGTTYDLSTVSASSGLPVTLTSADIYVGTIDGSIFSSLHPGTTVITASQAGNNNYNEAESVTVMITVVNTVENDVIVHQAVSPNGDGKNDFLLIEGIQNYPNKVTLINQNGGKIYEVSNYDNNTRMFDGHSNLNGAFQLQGTYYYLVEYTKDNKTIKKTGFFVLKY